MNRVCYEITKIMFIGLIICGGTALWFWGRTDRLKDRLMIVQEDREQINHMLKRTNDELHVVQNHDVGAITNSTGGTASQVGMTIDIGRDDTDVFDARTTDIRMRTMKNVSIIKIYLFIVKPEAFKAWKRVDKASVIHDSKPRTWSKECGRSPNKGSTRSMTRNARLHVFADAGPLSSSHCSYDNSALLANASRSSR